MIGLVTYDKFPDLTDDDRPLIEEFRRLGHDARAVRWDDTSVGWHEFHALVLRSCWDYHLRPAEFRDWLDRVSEARIPLWNSAEVVRWNMHKSYLRDLAGRNVLIPETQWIAKGERRTLTDVLHQRGWTEAVVKPAISASATHTWRVHDSRTSRVPFDALVRESDVLVQELIPEIAAEGEWSIVLIDGAISHAALKRPKAGDFRVQWEHGGSSQRADAPPQVTSAALATARHIPGPWLYARVDGVMTGRGFMLMEIECIEPHLFFAYRPASRAQFANALASRLV
ncbi:MAG TPA: hypothetical protein VJ867_03240 [Gemmatimonadaceae bacterium]|nr:hypothetical protein [Gemmatimonadaceae bacterium]